MAFITNDRVKETTATTGTGTVTLAGAVTHFEAFSAIGNTNTTYYCIVHEDTAYDEWEVGYGVYTSSGTTLTRTAVTSSNGDALVSFTAGTKSVFCTLPANKCVIKDTSGNLVYGDGTATGFITSVAGDSSPQLGGDLDVVTYDIVSTSDRDIDIIPNGTGNVNLGADTVQVGDNDANATITTQGTGDLILNTNAGTDSGTITIADAANGDVTLAADGTGLIKMTANSVTGDVIPGKFGGTNFSSSLLVGHATSGTLSTASNNTGVGFTALDALTSGDNNAALGSGSGSLNSSSSQNTYLGAVAGARIATGSGYNNYTGYGAGYFNATGAYNTGVGAQALMGVDGQSNSGNTGVGYNSVVAITTGDYNIGLGYLSGDNITSGSGNVVIGKADVSSATGDDQLSISDGEDGAVVWITGESTGNVEINEVWNPSLSTTGKALVMGF